MENIKTVFGANLRFFRASKGYSQRKLNDITGIDHAMISRMENGQINVTVQTISILAQALETTPEKLLRPQCQEHKLLTSAPAEGGV